MSINGVTNNVIECVVITKTLSVNIKEIVKTFSINSFASKKPLSVADDFGEITFRQCFQQSYDFPYGISTFLTFVSLSDRMHIFVGFKLIVQKLSVTQVFGFPVFS